MGEYDNSTTMKKGKIDDEYGYGVGRSRISNVKDTRYDTKTYRSDDYN